MTSIFYGKGIAFLVIICLTLSSCNYKFFENFSEKSKKQLVLKDKIFKTSDGYTIAYSDNERKDKPVIFFVHGYLTSRLEFFSMAKNFDNDNYRMVFVDLPGFGESSKDPNGDYKLTSQAKRLNELIKKLNLKDVNLVGTSLGGGVCIAMNGMNPEIKSSTLLAPFGMPLYSQELPRVLKYFLKTGEIVFIIDEPYKNKKTKKLFFFGTNIPAFLVPGFILKELKEFYIRDGLSANKVGKDVLYDKNDFIRILSEHPKYSRIIKEKGINLSGINSESEEIIDIFNKINENDKITKIDPIGESFESMIPYLDKINNPILVIWGKKDNIIHYKTMEGMKPHIKYGSYKLFKTAGGSHSIARLRAKGVYKLMSKMMNEIKD